MIYKRLPGARRALIFGASIWLGPDHLLAVRSARFREEYKRYYFRDIQAIAVADATRWHVSTRSILIAAVWGISYPVLSSVGRTDPWWWVGATLLVMAWIAVSAFGSCRCRITTAVSSDEVASVYRRWTARRFLDEVTPKIAEAQGVMEGNWAAEVEARAAAPAESTAAAAATPRTKDTGPVRSWATDVLVGGLLAAGLADAVGLSHPSKAVTWAGLACTLLVLVGAMGTMAQRFRKKLRRPLQRVAVATLIVMGVLFYAKVIALSTAAQQQKTVLQNDAVLTQAPLLLRQIEIGAEVALGLIGLVIVLMADETS